MPVPAAAGQLICVIAAVRPRWQWSPGRPLPNWGGREVAALMGSALKGSGSQRVVASR
jgi:hypothetical protein